MSRPLLDRIEKPAAAFALGLTVVGFLASLWSALDNTGNTFVAGVAMIVAGCFFYCGLLLAFTIRSARRDK